LIVAIALARKDAPFGAVPSPSIGAVCPDQPNVPAGMMIFAPSLAIAPSKPMSDISQPSAPASPFNAATPIPACDWPVAP